MAIKPQFIKSKMGGSSFTWKYPMPAVPEIAVYTFDATSDVMPTFNTGFTNYTVKDVDNGDGTITRTISSYKLPTKINFKDKSTLLTVKYLNTSNVTDMYQMFYNCSSLTSLDVSNLNTSNVTDMSNMFYNCSSLTSLDLSNFNTSKVTSMYFMFYFCTSLTSLNVSNFNTSNVTKMYSMFSYCSKLTSLDVSNFNTSKVTNMSKMFLNCKLLTSLDVSNFNTGNVTDMNCMFSNCSKLTSLDASNFDTSKVTNMRDMFSYCSLLTSLDLSNFNTSNVTNMSYMFKDVPSTVDWCFDGINYTNFTLTEEQTSYSGTFPWNEYYIEYTVNNSESIALNSTLGDGHYPNLPELTINGNISYDYRAVRITKNDNSLTSDLTTTLDQIKSIRIFYPSNVTSIKFVESTIHNNDDGWHVGGGENDYIGPSIDSVIYVDTKNFTSFDDMFYNCDLESVNTSGWDTSNVISMRNTFSRCSSLTSLDVSNFDTSNVTDMSGMFANCDDLVSIIGLEDLDTGSVTNMGSIFHFCSSLTSLDLSDWDTSNVTDMSYMFNYCTSLTSLDLSSFDTSSVTSMSDMFTSVSTSVDWNYDGSNYANFTLTETDTGYSGIFPWNLVTLAKYTFSSDTDVLPILNRGSIELTYENNRVIIPIGTSIDAIYSERHECVNSYYSGDYEVYELTDAHLGGPGSEDYGTHSYFYYHLNGGESYFEYNSYEEETIYIETSLSGDITIKDVNNGDIITRTLYGDAPYSISFRDSNVLSVDYLDTSNVTNMSYMFSGCKSLTSLDLSNFDTNKVTNMSYMFYNCKKLTSLDLSSFNTSKVTNMASMFEGCESLTSLDLSNFDTNNVEDMYSMFWDVPAIDNWNYTGDNYTNWTLPEGSVDYNSVFPWNVMDVIFKIGGNPDDPLSDYNYRVFSSNSEGGLDIDFVHLITLKNGNVVTDDTGLLIGDVDYITVKGRKQGVYFGNNIVSEIIQIDTSEFTSFRTMFSYCHNLVSLDLSNWNTSKVETMSYMFQDCPNLTYLNLSGWDVGNLENLSRAFIDCISLETLDLTGWNIGNKLTNLYSAFNNCQSLTSLDLSGWDTSNVTNMRSMFKGCESLTSLDLSGWDTNNVTSYSSMFFDIPTSVDWHYDGNNYANFTLTESEAGYSGTFPWNVAPYVEYTIRKAPWQLNDTYLRCILPWLHNGTGYVDVTSDMLTITMKDGTETSDTSVLFSPTLSDNVEKIRVTYDKTIKSVKFRGRPPGEVGDYFNHLLKEFIHFDTKYLTDMSYMFYFSDFTPNEVIENLNTSNVTNMYSMFERTTVQDNITSLDLSRWRTSNVTNMSRMFYLCTSLTTLDLSNWDTSNVTNMNSMFGYCSKLEDINISSFDTRKVTNSGSMFYDVPAEVEWNYDGSNYSNFNLTESATSYSGTFPWNLVTVAKYTFTSTTDTLPTFNSEFTDYTVTDVDNGDGTTTRTITIGKTDTLPTSISFKGKSNLLTVEELDTSNVTNMSNMFSNCYKLTSLNVSNFNTSNVTNMNDMFSNCNKLTSLDLSNCDTSKVTSMKNMFQYCTSLTSLDLSNFDTSNVTDMYGMFYGCKSLTSLDVSNFNTSNVTNMYVMFYGCSSLTSLDLSIFNTSNVTNMDYMFCNCSSLTSLDLSNFDTSKVKYMGQMFQYCTSLTSLDLSSFNTSNVTSMRYMFSDCTALTSLNLSNFNTSKVTNISNMFTGISKLSQLHMDYCSSDTVTTVLKVINNRSSTTSGTLYVTNSVYTSVKSLANSKNWYSSPEMENGGSND